MYLCEYYLYNLFSFWQKCCQAYAEQLQEQGYVLQSVVYLLAIHFQREAIEVLMQKSYYKEALLIARIYLQPDDPLNETIVEQWITHLISNGNLTGAALLYVLLSLYVPFLTFITRITFCSSYTFVGVC